MSGEQKLKEEDSIVQTVEATNNTELLFFTDRCQVYKTRASEFADTKASVLGDFVAAKLGFDEGESAVAMIVTTDYKGCLLFFFETESLLRCRWTPMPPKPTVSGSPTRILRNRPYAGFTISRRIRNFC